MSESLTVCLHIGHIKFFFPKCGNLICSWSFVFVETAHCFTLAAEAVVAGAEDAGVVEAGVLEAGALTARVDVAGVEAP